MFLAIRGEPGEERVYLEKANSIVARDIQVRTDIKYYSITLDAQSAPTLSAQVTIRAASRTQVRTVVSVELEAVGAVIDSTEVEV